jgi:hypothetical protein
MERDAELVDSVLKRRAALGGAAALAAMAGLVGRTGHASAHGLVGRTGHASAHGKKVDYSDPH